MHTLLGFADLLASPSFGELNSEQTGFVAQMRLAAGRMLELADACVDLVDGRVTGLSPHTAPVHLASFLRQASFALAHADGVAAPEVVVDVALEQSQTLVDGEVLRRVFKLASMLLRREGASPMRVESALFESMAIITVSYEADNGALLFVTPDEIEPSLSSRELVRIKLMEVLLSRYQATLRSSSNVRVLELCLPLLEGIKASPA